MIGPMKLSEIKAVLRERFSEGGDDPIQWLNDQICVAKQRRKPKPDGAQVLEELRRLLEEPIPKKRRKKRVVRGSR